MRKIILISTILVAELIAPLFTQAQGTLYLSNLGEGSSGGAAVASDAWAAAFFQTGFNIPGGYTLDSIQLSFSESSGSPIGLSVSIYQPNRTSLLGNYLGSLSGADPTAAGVFTYVSTSPIPLNWGQGYVIVVTAETSLAQGAFFWNQADSYSYSTALWPGSYGSDISTDGVNWTGAGYPFQFAIYATAIPEPATLALAALGLAALGFWQRKP